MPSTYDYVRNILTSAPGKSFCVACLPTEVREIGGDGNLAAVTDALAKLSEMAGFQRTPRSGSVSCDCGGDGYGAIRFRSKK